MICKPAILFPDVFVRPYRRFACLVVASAMALTPLACGGGGGGGGGGAAPPPPTDSPSPVISFIAPSGSSLTYTNQESSLPDSIQVRYSTPSGTIRTSSLKVSMTFQTFALDLTGDFTSAGSSESRAGTSEGMSPLYKTAVSGYPAGGASPNFLGTVAGIPGKIVADGRGEKIYLIDQTEKLLNVVSVQTGKSLKTFSLSGQATDAAVHPGRNALYLGVEGSNRPVIVDGDALTMTQGPVLSATPHRLAVNPALDRIYIGFEDVAQAVEMNAATGALTGVSYSLSGKPFFLFAPNGNNAVFYYARLGLGNGVFKVDNGVESQIGSMTRTPGDAVYSQSASKLFYTDPSAGSVRSFSLSNGQEGAAISVGALPNDIVSDSGTGRMYVFNATDETVSVLSSSGSVERTLSIGKPVEGIAVDGSSGEFFAVLNLWKIKASAQGTLNAEISNSFNKKASAELKFTVNPATPGGTDPPSSPGG